MDMYLLICGSIPYLSREKIVPGDYVTHCGQRVIYINTKKTESVTKIKIDSNHRLFYFYYKNKTPEFKTYQNYSSLSEAIENNQVAPDGDAYTVDYILLKKLEF